MGRSVPLLVSSYFEQKSKEWKMKFVTALLFPHVNKTKYFLI